MASTAVNTVKKKPAVKRAPKPKVVVDTRFYLEFDMPAGVTMEDCYGNHQSWDVKRSAIPTAISVLKEVITELERLM